MKNTANKYGEGGSRERGLREICVRKVYKALNNYTPKSDKEMDLIRGDIITEGQTLDKHWGFGRNFRGFLGLFPLSYVVEICEDQNLRLPVDALLNEIGQMSLNEKNRNSSKRSGICETDDDFTDEEEEREKDDDQIKIPPIEIENPSKSSDSNPENSKPQMLVKPRPSYAEKNVFFQNNGSSGSMKNSFVNDLRKTNTIGTVTYIPNRLMDLDPYYSQPSSYCANYCRCGREKLSKSKICRRASSAELYENTQATKSQMKGQSHRKSSNSNSSSALLFARVTPRPEASSSLRLRNMHTSNQIPKPSYSPLPLIQPHSNRLTLTRLIACCLTVLFIGAVVFVLMYFLANINILFCLVIVTLIVILLFFILIFSKLIRSVLSILLPSLSSDCGHVFFILLLLLFLSLGPIRDAEQNISTTLSSLSCFWQQVNNQTSLITHPYDSVMQNINITLFRVEQAAKEIDRGLLPLDQGLGQIELGINYANSNLLNTEKTCRYQFSRAYNSCKEGLTHAMERCRKVMRDFKGVYRDAKEALERINPTKIGDRTRKRRQITSNMILNKEHDLCKPLDENSACGHLKENPNVCEPSQWAGMMIQQAINKTQAALKDIFNHFHFHITSFPYIETRRKSEEAAKKINHEIINQYKKYNEMFYFVVDVLLLLTPLLLLLLLHSSYKYVHSFIVDETYDNCYIDKKFKLLDRRNGSHETLTPFKSHELLYIKTSLRTFNGPNKCRNLGFTLFFLFLFLLFLFYYMNCKIYMSLKTIFRLKNEVEDLSGWKSLDEVVVGEGLIVDLIDSFIKNLHPRGFASHSIDNTFCLPKKIYFSFLFLIINVSLISFFLFSIILKPQVLKSRNKIIGYFYNQVEAKRSLWLHSHLHKRRTLYPHLLYSMVLENAKKKLMRSNVSWMHECLSKMNSCSCERRCLLCQKKGYKIKTCPSLNCLGTYCCPCFKDMHFICPLCHISIASTV